MLPAASLMKAEYDQTCPTAAAMPVFVSSWMVAVPADDVVPLKRVSI